MVLCTDFCSLHGGKTKNTYYIYNDVCIYIYYRYNFHVHIHIDFLYLLLYLSFLHIDWFISSFVYAFHSLIIHLYTFSVNSPSNRQGSCRANVDRRADRGDVLIKMIKQQP